MPYTQIQLLLAQPILVPTLPLDLTPTNFHLNPQLQIENVS